MAPLLGRVAAAAVLVHAAQAAIGFDLSQSLDLGTAQCLVQSGSFAIVRGWCSFGGVDSNMPGSVANLWSAGFAHVDVYGSF